MSEAFAGAKDISTVDAREAGVMGQLDSAPPAQAVPPVQTQTQVEQPPAGPAAPPPVEPASIDEATEVLNRPSTFEGGRPSARNIEERNINFDNLDTPDDIKSLIDSLAKQKTNYYDGQRRGSVSHEQTIEESGQFTSEQLQELIGAPPGKAYNAAEMTAIRDLMVAAGKEADRLSDFVLNNPSDEVAMLRFRQSLAVFNGIEAHVAGAAAEAGRALNALKIKANGDRSVMRELRRVHDEVGGPEATVRLAQRIQDARGNTEQVARIAREDAFASTGDMIMEHWINGLLTGPKTHLANLTGNTITPAWAVLDRAVGARISIFRRMHGGEGGIEPGEALAMLFGWKHSLREGFGLALRNQFKDPNTWKLMAGTRLEHKQNAISGENVSRTFWGSRLGVTPTNTAGVAFDYIGKAVQFLGGRLLNSGDVMARATSYRMQLYSMAHRSVQAKGLTGQAKIDEIIRLVQNPPEDIHFSADDFADENTFQTPLGATGRAASRFMSEYPMTRLLLPFMRTPINIMKWVLNHTPASATWELSAANPEAKKIVGAIKAGGAEGDLAMAKMATGTTMIAAAAFMAEEDRCVGGLYGSKGRAMRRQNIPPYSCKIGDTWVTYNRLDPVGMLIGLGADVHTISAMAPRTIEGEQEVSDMMVAGALAVTSNLASKTYLMTVMDVFDALNSPDRPDKLERILRRYPGTLITPMSSLARTATQAIDPIIHGTKTLNWWDETLARYGFLHDPDEYSDIRNLWGDRIDRRDAGPLFWLMPIAFHKEKYSLADREIQENEMYVSRPRDYRGSGRFKIQMTSQEYDYFMQGFAKEVRRHPNWDGYTPRKGQHPEGLTLKPYIEALIRSDVYQAQTRGPDGGREKLLTGAVEEYVVAANKVVDAKGGWAGGELSEFAAKWKASKGSKVEELTGQPVPDAIQMLGGQ
jgi:hypothetical protein